MTATAEPMTPFKRFRTLLSALFQLDFGLYRCPGYHTHPHMDRGTLTRRVLEIGPGWAR